MLNSDMSVAALAHSEAMNWQSSPSATVSRKRFHLVGEPEQGQVTSLVRYEPGASFPLHPHPGGEEILVLSGIFSDETGHWPAGSYLLNPEGFSHSPRSEAGCQLLVKLRQYAGEETVRRSLDSVPATQVDGLTARLLHQISDQKTLVLELPAGTQINRQFTGGGEGFVLNGILHFNGTRLDQYDWFRFPEDHEVNLTSEGASLYLKTGAVSQLWSQP